MAGRICTDCGRELPAWNKHRKCERCRKAAPCPTCGQPMYRKSTQCIHCQAANSTGEANHNWKGGKSYNWYESYIKPYKKSNPEKIHAHRMVVAAIRRGELYRPKACQDCGATWGPIEAHHDDYSKPLSVRWLCKSCHWKADEQRRDHEQVVVSESVSEIVYEGECFKK